ncbi:MAG: hypothetical protein PHH40_00995 [Candidatus Moranbacteria bacterium]|nr:hypothetical protein [Candidatus Moranbacteria bacterium]MDD3964891.1 hypothetical protein [Candidatus Moranbacteria bacterium]
MYEGFLQERDESDAKNDIAEETIIHVQELLDDGLYDEDARNRAIIMLEEARLSTKDERAIEQIDMLLEDIETRYGDV